MNLLHKLNKLKKFNQTLALYMALTGFSVFGYSNNTHAETILQNPRMEYPQAKESPNNKKNQYLEPLEIAVRKVEEPIKSEEEKDREIKKIEKRLHSMGLKEERLEDKIRYENDNLYDETKDYVQFNTKPLELEDKVTIYYKPSPFGKWKSTSVEGGDEIKFNKVFGGKFRVECKDSNLNVGMYKLSDSKPINVIDRGHPSKFGGFKYKVANDNYHFGGNLVTKEMGNIKSKDVIRVTYNYSSPKVTVTKDGNGIYFRTEKREINNLYSVRVSAGDGRTSSFSIRVSS